MDVDYLEPDISLQSLRKSNVKKNYDPFIRWNIHFLALFIMERRRIEIKKARGVPQPWTKDPILRDFHFCCIRREDDATSKVMKEIFKGIDPRHGAYAFNIWLHRYLSNIPACRTLGYVYSMSKLASTSFVIDGRFANQKNETGLKACLKQLRIWMKQGALFRTRRFISSANDDTIIEAIKLNWKLSHTIGRDFFTANNPTWDCPPFPAPSESELKSSPSKSYPLPNYIPDPILHTQENLAKLLEKNFQLCAGFHSFQDSCDGVMYEAV
ncbi:hypothetical protein HDU76_004904 [Blyttiomyces sp. JEL0837]|nr:hypothetical protein HDU76_004904 [Blyttiomyces sp. JEL0837]